MLCSMVYRVAHAMFHCHCVCLSVTVQYCIEMPECSEELLGTEACLLGVVMMFVDMDCVQLTSRVLTVNLSSVVSHLRHLFTRTSVSPSIRPSVCQLTLYLYDIAVSLSLVQCSSEFNLRHCIMWSLRDSGAFCYRWYSVVSTGQGDHPPRSEPSVTVGTVWWVLVRVTIHQGLWAFCYSWYSAVSSGPGDHPPRSVSLLLQLVQCGGI